MSHHNLKAQQAVGYSTIAAIVKDPRKHKVSPFGRENGLDRGYLACCSRE